VKKQLMTIVATAALIFIPAMAKDKVTTHQVHFDKGTNGTTVKGHVKGYDTVNYKLSAQSGQSMRVSLESKKAFINIFEPGKGVGDGAMLMNAFLDSKDTRIDCPLCALSL